MLKSSFDNVVQLNDIALNIRWQSFGTCIASTDHQSNAWSPFLIFSLILPSFSILDILAVSSFCSFSPLGMAPPEVVSCFSWSPLIFWHLLISFGTTSQTVSPNGVLFVWSVCVCVRVFYLYQGCLTLVPSRLIPDISKHFPHNMFPNTESPTCFAFPSFSPVAGQTFVAFERESRSRRSDSSWDRNSDGEWRRRKVYLLNARCFAVLLWRLGEHNKSWAQCDSATMRHCDTATSEESWGHQGYDLQWAMYNLLAYCCGKVLAVLYIRKYPYCHTNTILQYRSKFSTCYAKAVLLNSPWWEPNFVARSGFGQGHRCHSSSGSFPFPEPEEVIKSHKYVNRLWFNDGIK